MDRWIKENKIFLFILVLASLGFYFLGKYSLLDFKFNNWITGIIFLIILIIIASRILKINEKRNALDILFFNSTLAILAIFMIGILNNEPTIWKYIVISLAIIATGEKIVGFFTRQN